MSATANSPAVAWIAPQFKDRAPDAAKQDTSKGDANEARVPLNEDEKCVVTWSEENEREYQAAQTAYKGSPSQELVLGHPMNIRRHYNSDLPLTTTCEFIEASREVSFNACKFIKFSDGMIMLYKCGTDISEDKWTAEQQRHMENVQNLIATLRRRTTIPIPSVYDWSSTFDNAIGHPFVLEEYANGHTVWEVIAGSNEESSGPVSTRTMYELSGYLRELNDVAFFNGIGTPVVRDDHYLGMDPVYTSWEQLSKPFEKARDHSHNQFEIDQIVRGPTCEGLYLRLFLKWLSELHRENGIFRLYHPDCNESNIMIDDTGHIVAIVDWNSLQSGPEYLGLSAYPRLACLDWYAFSEGEHNNSRIKIKPSRCCGGIGDAKLSDEKAKDLESSHDFWQKVRMAWDLIAEERDRRPGSTIHMSKHLNDEKVQHTWQLVNRLIENDERKSRDFSGLFIQNLADGSFIGQHEGSVTHILGNIVMTDRQENFGQKYGLDPLPTVQQLMANANAGLLEISRLTLIKRYFPEMLYYPGARNAKIYAPREIYDDDKILHEIKHLKLNNGNRVRPGRIPLYRWHIDYTEMVADAKEAEEIERDAKQCQPRNPYTSFGKDCNVELPKVKVARELRKKIGSPRDLCNRACIQLQKDFKGNARLKAKSPEAEVVVEYVTQMLCTVKYNHTIQKLVFGRVVYDHKQKEAHLEEASESGVSTAESLASTLEEQDSHQDSMRHISSDESISAVRVLDEDAPRPRSAETLSETVHATQSTYHSAQGSEQVPEARNDDVSVSPVESPVDSQAELRASIEKRTKGLREHSPPTAIPSGSVWSSSSSSIHITPPCYDPQREGYASQTASDIMCDANISPLAKNEPAHVEARPVNNLESTSGGDRSTDQSTHDHSESSPEASPSSSATFVSPQCSDKCHGHENCMPADEAQSKLSAMDERIEQLTQALNEVKAQQDQSKQSDTALVDDQGSRANTRGKPSVGTVSVTGTLSKDTTANVNANHTPTPISAQRTKLRYHIAASPGILTSSLLRHRGGLKNMHCNIEISVKLRATRPKAGKKRVDQGAIFIAVDESDDPSRTLVSVNSRMSTSGVEGKLEKQAELPERSITSTQEPPQTRPFVHDPAMRLTSSTHPGHVPSILARLGLAATHRQRLITHYLQTPHTNLSTIQQAHSAPPQPSVTMPPSPAGPATFSNSELDISEAEFNATPTPVPLLARIGGYFNAALRFIAELPEDADSGGGFVDAFLRGSLIKGYVKSDAAATVNEERRSSHSYGFDLDRRATRTDRDKEDTMNCSGKARYATSQI